MLVKNLELHEAICKEGFNGKKSVFKPLSTQERTILLDVAISHVFEKGKTIYSDREKLKGILYLVKGKAKISKIGINQKEQIVRLSSSHRFIGYRALFAEQVTYAAATALEHTTLLEFPFDSIIKVIHSNSNFAMQLLRSFAFDLKFAEDRTITLTQKHIRGRLAESLLLLVERYGLEADGETLQVVLSREDIAKLSNMTPSNAIRTLSAFANEGVIYLEGRMIKIIDKKALQRISNMG